MRAPLKIVHTSDVHLDSRGEEAAADGFRSRAERAFAGVVDTALAEAADLLLIAGDLFDNNRVDDSNIEFVYGQFSRLDSPVVMLPGNHDVHDERSVWPPLRFRRSRQARARTDGPRRRLRRPGRHRRARLGVGPCASMRRRTTAARGAVAPPAPLEHRHGPRPVVERRVGQGSSPITRSEIRNSGFDYLALGHIHVWGEHSEGDTVAYYCGSPVAHFAGANGGRVAVVTLCPEAGVVVESRQVSLWETNGREQQGYRGNGFPW